MALNTLGVTLEDDVYLFTLPGSHDYINEYISYNGIERTSSRYGPSFLLG
jgi:hypothetical protein